MNTVKNIAYAAVAINTILEPVQVLVVALVLSLGYLAIIKGKRSLLGVVLRPQGPLPTRGEEGKVG